MRNYFQMLNFVQGAVKNYKLLLSQFVKFKTVSASSKYSKDIQDCVNWLKELLIENGFEVKLFDILDSNPLIFARYKVTTNAKTLLLYGHYDVQPAEKDDGWKNDPFILQEEDGKYIGRGVADNKGQLLLHLLSLFELIKKNKLKYNIKILIEGNEETGSVGLPSFIKDHAKLLKADYSIISDGELSNNSPTIELGFRGNANLTLSIESANSTVHSGMYGNTIPSAVQELIKIISLIYTPDNKIDIDGFYEDSILDHSLIKNTIISDEESYNCIIKDLGIKKTFVENDLDFQYNIGLLPSFVVSGIEGGHYGDGYANIVPNKAKAKINIRFGPGQDVDKILFNVQKYFSQRMPTYINYEIDISTATSGIILNPDNEFFRKTEKILKETFDKKVVYKYVGGSLPIVNSFVNDLGCILLSVPLANSNCNMHGVGENLTLVNAYFGARFCSSLYIG